jgi:mannose-6-phosphate isomerase-like protein (cupin superfamily)
MSKVQTKTSFIAERIGLKIMGERPIVDDHPNKVKVDTFAPDGTLKAEDGWINMNVKFLITEDSVNSQHQVFGITIMPPGAKHDIHRHPHADEVEYLVEGEGIARVGDVDVRMKAGEIVYVSPDEYHGFENTSQTERAVIVWTYGGAASLKKAGYITLNDDEKQKEQATAN